MRSTRFHLIVLSAMLTVSGAERMAQAQLGTSFTYQGQLKQAEEPVSGECEFEFSLWNAAADGDQIGATQYVSNVEVQEGLFTVLLNVAGEFGDSAFDGQPRWLEITVEVPPDPPVTLSPRQPLTPTPYAFYAAAAPWGGLTDMPDDFADGVDDGTTYEFGEGLLWDGVILSVDPEYRLPQACADGQVPKWNSLTDLWECANDETGGGGQCWLLTGNSGTTPGVDFLGTTDNVALELRVNNAGALRIEPDPTSPNLIGGYSANYVTPGVRAATIGGGGASNYANRVTDNYGTVGGGGNNQAGDDAGATDDRTFATVGGGWDNTASAAYATVGGGGQNRAGSSDGDPEAATYATVGGGQQNWADAAHVTIAGGLSNSAWGTAATIAGGNINEAAGEYASIGGGYYDMAGGAYATVAGGRYNFASGQYAAIGGGGYNRVVHEADYGTIAGGGPSDPNDPNTYNHVFDNHGTIGGGGYNRAGTDDGNPTTAAYATVSGGEGNVAASFGATVGGGIHDTATGSAATVGGGFLNTATGSAATIAGGSTNAASGTHAGVLGGFQNAAAGDKATVGAGSFNSASGDRAVVGGGSSNSATGEYATIGGGGFNAAGASHSTVPGGHTNRVSDNYGTIGGGGNNRAGSDDGDPNTAIYATVAGGENNNAAAPFASIGGGQANTVSNDWSTVAGGVGNVASGSTATVGGGSLSNATGAGSTVAGGASNQATADFATVGGGIDNVSDSVYATVAGGWDNTASNFAATVGGGNSNTASGSYAVVAGGHGNIASGLRSMVPGGLYNTAAGDYSFAAGRGANADDPGAFVWADSGEEANFSPGPDTFTIGAANGVFVTADSPSGGYNAYGLNVANMGTGGGINVLTYADAEYGVSIMNYGAGAALYSYGSPGYAAYLQGDVHVTGTITKGDCQFKIDHPLDPANKYLVHSCVESSDQMNVYNGNVVLDGRGEATVELPEWFEALNRDFRYHITCIGGFAPVYIADEITDNRFKIAGGKPGLKVSWQVTGIRQDAYANANPMLVEVDKPEEERGTYLHPEAHGVPAELGTGYEERQARLSWLEGYEADCDLEN